MAFSYLINRKWAGDPRFTNHIGPTGSALAKVKQLESYYFYFNELGQSFGYGQVEEGGSPIRQIGLIAQDLMAIEPSLVKTMDEDWAEFETEDYYWVDYEALQILCLDALNELNEKADNIKTQLNMPVETYPEIYSGPMPQLPSSNYSITGINVNPVNAAEGTTVTWNLTGTSLPEGLRVFFKLTGTFNYLDISHVSVGADDMSDLQLWPESGAEEAGLSKPKFGDAFGLFAIDSTGSASITMKYIKDNLAEGDETIIMTLWPEDSFGVATGELSTTATITDS